MNFVWWGAALFVALATLTRFIWRKWKTRRRAIEVLQGDSTEIRSTLQKVSKKEGEHYLWGNEFLDDDQASLHFLALGSTGSGKTINILLLMRSVFKRLMEPGSGIRSLVYDSKTDMLSLIRGMGVKEDDIQVLNPFDQRRHAWDIAKDITTPPEADDMATLLIPSDSNSKNPYFTNTAQRFLSGVIRAFQQNAPGQWTLRDLVLSARNPELLQEIFKSCKYTKDLCRHFGADVTSENIRSTMDSALLVLESIAASWHRAEKKFTLADWLTQQKVLVLGNSPKGKEPIRKINQLLFTSISKAILGQPGRAKTKHWFFLDELRELGELDYLADMMIVGRSKGASMVLGFQDIYGLYAEYGKERASEIVGCTQNFALLRINATQPETQKWASDVAGQLRYIDRKRTSGTSYSNGGVNNSDGISEETKTDLIYIPSFFSREILQTNEENGMLGVYFTKGMLYEQPYRPEVLFGDQPNVNRVPNPSANYSDHIPLPDDEMLLEPWTAADLVRLKIVPSESEGDTEDKKTMQDLPT